MHANYCDNADLYDVMHITTIVRECIRWWIDARAERSESQLGEELCDKIRIRTKKGQDVDDSNFKKLSKGCIATSLARPAVLRIAASQKLWPPGFSTSE